MAVLDALAAGKWRGRSGGTVNRRIFRAAFIVSSASSVYFLAMVGRELLLAVWFGTSDELDAFLVAVSIPFFVVNVIAGSFASAMVPTFVRLRDRDGADEAQRFFSSAMTLGAGLLLVAAILLALAISFLLPFLASGFSPEKLALTRQLFFILLPIVLLSGMATMWSAVLNAGERFALVAFSPALVPIAAITAVYFGANAWGILALAVGTTVGFAFQCCLLGWGMIRKGMRLRHHWVVDHETIRHAIDQYLPLAAAAVLLSGSVLVDQAVAAALAPGSVATLGYGKKVVALIISFGAGAFGTAVLPYASKLVAAGDWDQVRQTTRMYSLLVFLVTIPLVAILFEASEPIVATIFQRGAFTAADTVDVARVQALYALQIPFFALATLYNRLHLSFGANHVVLAATLIGFVVNVALDLALAPVLGVAGIALATAVMQVATSGFYVFMFRRTLAKVAIRADGASV